MWTRNSLYPEKIKSDGKTIGFYFLKISWLFHSRFYPLSCAAKANKP